MADEKICWCLDFIYFFVPTHINFSYYPRGSSSLAYISVAMNHNPSIYLSLLMMAETPHSRERWPEWPLCVIAADQWSISICPWSHDLPERQPTAGMGWGGKEREGKQENVVWKVRGQQEVMEEVNEECGEIGWGREKGERNRWIKGQGRPCGEVEVKRKGGAAEEEENETAE